MGKIAGKGIKSVIVTLCWLMLWQLASMAVNNGLFLPAPLVVISSLFKLMGDAVFYKSALYSLLRVLLGYIAAVFAGIILGTATAMLPFAGAFLKPMRSIIKAAPVVSFILLVLLWMKMNIVPAFIAFLMVMPVVWANVEQGVKQTDRQLLELAKLYRFGFKKTFLHIYLPSVMPLLLPACATGVGFAWKSGVAAEVIARTTYSIGKELIESKSSLETADMFAWTALVILLSIIFEQSLTKFFNKLGASARWEQSIDKK